MMTFLDDSYLSLSRDGGEYYVQQQKAKTKRGDKLPGYTQVPLFKSLVPQVGDEISSEIRSRWSSSSHHTSRC